MVRSGKDSFFAMLIANAMLSEDAEIISISYGAECGTLMTFSVFAKVDDDAHIARVDEAIEATVGD